MSSVHATCYHTSSLPMNMPRKPQHYIPGAVSPPEAALSTSSGVASYDASATTASSYAGSTSDFGYDGSISSSSSTSSTAGIDLLDYMRDRLAGAVDTLPLDRSLATQAQTSGELNAKTRELLQLQALAQSRLAATRKNFADGVRVAREVQRDLDWTQNRVTAINQRAQRQYPAEYQIAAARYPAPVDC